MESLNQMKRNKLWALCKKYDDKPFEAYRNALKADMVVFLESKGEVGEVCDDICDVKKPTRPRKGKKVVDDDEVGGCVLCGK